MGDRRKLNTRVDEDVISDFREFVQEKKGKVRGEMGREVERALIEYMDRDRYARIEEEQQAMNEKLDAALAALAEGGEHTHTGSATPQTQTEKAEQIGAILNDSDAKVVPSEDVEEAIREVAGASTRTLRDYKELLKRKGHAYAHPSSDSHVWTVDADVFANWTESHVDDVPDAHLMEILEPYPIGIDEYERRVPA